MDSRFRGSDDGADHWLCFAKMRTAGSQQCALTGAALIDILISIRDIPMAQLVVRDLEDDVKTCLQSRAARHGRSLEAEVRDILRDAAKDEATPQGALGTRIASRFAALPLKEEEIPALPRQRLKPMSFEE
jgi:antitoxin FitA